MEIANSVVLLTGASSGIGRTTALALARRGARLAIVARRAPLLEALARECRTLGAACLPLPGDLGERNFAEKIVAATEEHFGCLDHVILNAGISSHRSVLHLAAEEAERVMRINFLSPMWTTLTAIPALLCRDAGSIVFVSSFAAKVCPPRESIYAASKSAMNSFAEGIRGDLQDSGIHVGVINPGAIDTPIWERRENEDPNGFGGHKHPPEVITEAIFEVIEKRTPEITAPRRDPGLLSARLLRAIAPATLQAGMNRMEPPDRELLERVRREARERRSRPTTN